jgi:hypothetical protein
MTKIKFKNGIYVMEIKDDGVFAGYIMKFRSRPLGYSYEITKDITKAHRWFNFIACQSFYFQFTPNRFTLYEKSNCLRTFQAKEVKLDIKLKRKIKLKKLSKFKYWYNRG